MQSTNEDFVSDVLTYFSNLPGAHLLLHKEQMYAVVYEDLTQNYPLWVFFLEDEEDLQPGYGDDLPLRDVDLKGWEVVATK